MSLTNIKSQAAQIRSEKIPGKNSAERVGKCLEDITDEFKNYARPSDINQLVNDTNAKLVKREKELDQLRDSISLGYFPDNIIYEAPQEMYAGNEMFSAVGYAQTHLFENDGLVNTVIGRLDTFPMGSTRVILRVQDNLSVVDPSVSSGAVLLDRNITEDDYNPQTAEVKIVLDTNVLVSAGKYLVCYFVDTDNLPRLGFREWCFGSARPEGYSVFLFKLGPGTEWMTAFSEGHYSYSQIPLKIYSSNAAYEKYKVLEERIDGFSAKAVESRLFLPSTIYAVVGKEINIYFDAITLLPEAGNGQIPVLIDVTCSKGVQTLRSWQFTPTTSDVGSHTLTISLYNNDGTISETKTATLKVSAAANPSLEKRILLTGDSTIDDYTALPIALYDNLKSMTGTAPLFTGAKQLPSNPSICHEAMTGKDTDFYANGWGAFKFTFEDAEEPTGTYPNWVMTQSDGSGYLVGMNVKFTSEKSGYVIANGWMHGTEIIGAGWKGILRMNSAPYQIRVTNTEMVTYSPFLFNGQLNFSSYAASVNIPAGKKIDLYSIDLGIIDCKGDLKTDAQISAIIENLKKLAGAFHTYNPQGKVMICLPKSASTSPLSSAHSCFRINIHRLRESILKQFDANSEYPYVIICSSGISIDRYYGYPLTTVKTAGRLSRTVEIHSDELHPSTEGYNQLADAYTACIATAFQ